MMTLVMKNTLKLALSSVMLFSLTACNDSVKSESGAQFTADKVGNNPGNSVSFNKAQMLTDLVDHVYLPTVTEFVTRTAEQTQAVTSYCNDLSSNQMENETLKQQAQNQWQNTMATWQQLEVMQVGPLVTDENFLRNEIYSWPVYNYCAVDLDVHYYQVGEIAGTPYDISRRTANRKGLDALEYLLFNPSLAHSCKTDTLGPAGWNSKSEMVRKVERCEFAIEVASELHDSALELEQQWLSEDGFANTLKTVNSATSGQFESIDKAINHLTDALFYIDSITKDIKLGAPIGLTPNSCGTASCLKDVESFYSNHTLANIKANLEAMLLVFEGSAPDNQIAFDDYLAAVDAEALADEMRNDITSTIALLDAFEGDFSTAVESNPAQIQDLYISIKKVTDNLKSTFIVFLSLQLPSSSAGDAD